ncbi:hypothetical protein ACJJIQ_00620 [Microbulbifer sp. ANSA003]|uniref:hypothetical protein n=1 Tax=unclassified Microbulbifer TaxID=2619833 RepID=UPI002B2800C9|nr:hypothetical protein QT397_07885 [Microbulbifer sp. MKSA007]
MQEVATQSVNRSASPEGRVLKAASAAWQRPQRTVTIRTELRLTPAAFKTRRGITELFRGSLYTALACTRPNAWTL